MSLAHILAGAGTGAVAGSIIPGLGTAVGAIAGGIAGAVLAPKASTAVVVAPPNAAPSASASADLVNAVVASHPLDPGSVSEAPRMVMPGYQLATMRAPDTSTAPPRYLTDTGGLPKFVPPPQITPLFTPASANTAPSAGAQADLVNAMIATVPPPPVVTVPPPTLVRPPPRMLGPPVRINQVIGPGSAPRPRLVALAGFGDIAPIPTWLVMVGLGTAAYLVWRK